ncbi:hypothetical protein PoB_000410800 [Plakobranchus ocellatus]|uniref:Uncharacterized protein n=1 Tax=Plakobranchus ocellatus TaxID=259542 RepID=A0AAV3Y601_9GAST|nr:hypothetical protein PoB_000410800 [Plakobranchus ocellatus]
MQERNGNECVAATVMDRRIKLAESTELFSIGQTRFITTDPSSPSLAKIIVLEPSASLRPSLTTPDASIGCPSQVCRESGDEREAWASESNLISAESLLTRVRAPPPAP